MIQNAVPQFLQPDVPAPLSATQTQFVADQASAAAAAQAAVAAYKAGDPPAGVWVEDGSGNLSWHPAATLIP